MKFVVVLMLFSLTYSLQFKHPNSLKNTIDYSFQGRNWIGPCKSGVRQSPIAIDKYNKIPKSLIKLQYGEDKGKIEFNGTFYRMDAIKKTNKIIYLDPKSKKSITYELKRIIFKTPAEHIVEGSQHKMEIQLVHQSDGKDHENKNPLMIVSIFADITEDDKKAHELFSQLDFYGKETNSISQLKNAMEDTKEYILYEGSQTIPGCVENVVWVIFKNPIMMRRHDYNSSRRLFCNQCMPYGNARAIQPLNKRLLYEYRLD